MFLKIFFNICLFSIICPFNIILAVSTVKVRARQKYSSLFNDTMALFENQASCTLMKGFPLLPTHSIQTIPNWTSKPSITFKFSSLCSTFFTASTIISGLISGYISSYLYLHLQNLTTILAASHQTCVPTRPSNL